jgi:hypothetical protein
MEKKFVKWAAIIWVLLILLSIVTTVIYIFTPSILSILLGTPVSCDSSGYNEGNISIAISSLCNVTKSSIGFIRFILFFASGFCVMITNSIFSIDIFQSAKPDGEKINWLAMIWGMPGLGNLLYYWCVKRNEKK